MNREKLGKCWVDLNCFRWNDLLHEMPDGFDELSFLEQKKFITPYMKEIEGMLGENSDMATSYYWWKYKLDRPAEEWINWYVFDRIRLEQ
ncbi:MAG: hypothetical protein ACRC1P_09500 [Cellulosilyticaceae bacterium]